MSHICSEYSGTYEWVKPLKWVCYAYQVEALTALSSCRSADFLFLQRLTGLTKGNLSSHLAKLEAGGLVAIEKGYAGKTPTTSLSLTKKGRAEIDSHWKRLDQLREAALEWQPET